jgi:hypothetical protein
MDKRAVELPNWWIELVLLNVFGAFGWLLLQWVAPSWLYVDLSEEFYMFYWGSILTSSNSIRPCTFLPKIFTILCICRALIALISCQVFHTCTHWKCRLHQAIREILIYVGNLSLLLHGFIQMSLLVLWHKFIAIVLFHRFSVILFLFKCFLFVIFCGTWSLKLHLGI